MPIDDNIAGVSAGLGGGATNSNGGSGCVGSYPVSGYTRSDGTEVSGYIRTCGAAHAGDNNNTNAESTNNADSENDWDYVNPDDLDEVLDKEILEDYYNYRTPVLEGQVEYDKSSPVRDYFRDKIDKIRNINSKYKNLSLLEAVQKAASKSPFGKSSEKQYYGISSHLADGEKPSKFMQEQNNFYKLGEITDPDLKNMYIKKAAAMYGLDPSSPDAYERVKNTDVVMPKPDSQLYNQIKNSETFQKWVAENYWKIKNNENYKTSIEFPKISGGDNIQKSLFATIHNADLYPKLNDDDSMTLTLSDGYDFDKLMLKHYRGAKSYGEVPKIWLDNRITNINNRALKQQEAGQIERFLLSTSISLTKEELEEILRKHSKY